MTLPPPSIMPFGEFVTCLHFISIIFLVSGDFVFVFVGRLVGDKGINELIEAFEGLVRDEGKGMSDEGKGKRERGMTIASEESLLSDLSDSFSRIKLLLVGPFESELDPLQPETLKVIETHSNIISVGFQSDVRP